MTISNDFSRRLSLLAVFLVCVFGWNSLFTSATSACAIESGNHSLTQEEDDDEDEDHHDGHEDKENPWGEDDDNWEEMGHHLELELHGLELERAGLETIFGLMELMEQVTNVARDAQTTAAFAVMHVDEVLEEEAAIKFLNESLQKTSDPVIQRLIRMKLMELHAEAEQQEKVMEQLRFLIHGK